MTVENGTTVTLCVFNVSYYHQTDFFVKIEQIENPDIPLSEAIFSHSASLCGSFRMYGFDYSRDTLSLTFYCTVSAENVTTSLTGGMKVGHPVRNSGAKFMLLERRHRLEVMQ